MVNDRARSEGTTGAVFENSGKGRRRSATSPLRIKKAHRHYVHFHYPPFRIVTLDNLLFQIPNNIISPRGGSSLNKVRQVKQIFQVILILDYK